MDLPSIGLGFALGYSTGAAVCAAFLHGFHWDDVLADSDGSRLWASINLLLLSFAWPWVFSQSIECADYVELVDATDEAGA